MGQPRIDIPQEAIAAFCRRHHIRKLSLFGSVLSDFGPIVISIFWLNLNPTCPWAGLIRMQDELSELLGGRKVDLVTQKFLNRRIQAKVQAEAVVQYAQR
jgi:predicted nucleotidyltransferase